MKILVVEDHADTARVMARLLETFGHEVALTNSVAGGVKSAREGAFDILVSDLGLPDATGIDLIKELRTFSQIPAIALSGFGMEEDVARCLEAGFNEHLTKPLDFQKLEAAIRRLASA